MAQNEHIYKRKSENITHILQNLSKNPISLTQPISFFAFLDPPRCQQEIDMYPEAGNHFGTQTSFRTSVPCFEQCLGVWYLDLFWALETPLPII